MPQIETIKASHAPPPPNKMTNSAQAILPSLSALKKDEVLRIQPDPDRSMRGLKTSVGRVASRNNLKVESWTDNADQYLYIRKV